MGCTAVSSPTGSCFFKTRRSVICPNVQKLTHRVKQDDETGKHVPNKSKDKVFRGKIMKWRLVTYLIKFKVMVIRIFRNSEEWKNTVRTPQ